MWHWGLLAAAGVGYYVWNKNKETDSLEDDVSVMDLGTIVEEDIPPDDDDDDDVEIEIDIEEEAYE